MLLGTSRCLVEVVQAVTARGVLLDGEGVDGESLKALPIERLERSA